MAIARAIGYSLSLIAGGVKKLEGQKNVKHDKFNNSKKANVDDKNDYMQPAQH